MGEIICTFLSLRGYILMNQANIFVYISLLSFYQYSWTSFKYSFVEESIRLHVEISQWLNLTTFFASATRSIKLSWHEDRPTVMFTLHLITDHLTVTSYKQTPLALEVSGCIAIFSHQITEGSGKRRKRYRTAKRTKTVWNDMTEKDKTTSADQLHMVCAISTKSLSCELLVRFVWTKIINLLLKKKGKIQTYTFL